MSLRSRILLFNKDCDKTAPYPNKTKAKSAITKLVESCSQPSFHLQQCIGTKSKLLSGAGTLALIPRLYGLLRNRIPISVPGLSLFENRITPSVLFYAFCNLFENKIATFVPRVSKRRNRMFIPVQNSFLHNLINVLTNFVPFTYH